MAGKEEKIDYIFPIFYSLQQPWASFFGMEKAIYRLPERKVTEFVVEGGKIRGTWPAGHFFKMNPLVLNPGSPTVQGLKTRGLSCA
ncbi:hypothetical protein [uncultured Bacteroides sp.]|uniref:hypothetical protein n=1 Tax=uncultured Bacteroides sp. TaxID=162156 RepID=UPI0026770FEE|nr:hypothetical protein [uncultured Bacteroides sp.]